jgi:hypothetical protein
MSGAGTFSVVAATVTVGDIVAVVGSTSVVAAGTIQLLRLVLVVLP